MRPLWKFSWGGGATAPPRTPVATCLTRKRQKYQDLINDQHKNYENLKFVNLSMSSLGVLSRTSLDFSEMLNDLRFNEQCRTSIVFEKLLIYVSGLHIIFSVSVTKNGITHDSNVTL